ncbi:hypothetical protein EDB86DRAFT_256784 [Lactarius hatsudake]|nr:hypothetical protein EDB86DRAFT_256784 [Lactarius hatsudake]
MRRANYAAYPRPSRDPNRLVDRSLDISPVVPPCSIAHQPRPPSPHLYIYIRAYAHAFAYTTTTPAPAAAALTNHAPEVNPLASLPPTIFPESARTEIAIPHVHSVTRTHRLILLIPWTKCKRRKSTQSGGVLLYEGRDWRARSPLISPRCRTYPRLLGQWRLCPNSVTDDCNRSR